MNYRELLEHYAQDGIPLVVDHHVIVELWFSGKGTREQKKELEAKIERAVITGDLKAVVLLRDPNAEGGHRELGKERWQFIKNCWYAGSFVSFQIHKDDFAAWLDRVGWFPNDSMLGFWWTTPLAVHFHERPNYEDWERYEEFAPLMEAVCFALGIHPAGVALWSRSQRENHDRLLKRAKAAIVAGTLKASEVVGEWHIEKCSFFEWVQRQRMELAGAFLERPVAARTHGEPATGIIPLVPPRNKDDWFKAISDAIKAYEIENNETPTSEKLWMRLIKSPPGDYAISFDDKNRCLIMAGGKRLDRDAFNGRWTRYYPAR